MATITPGDGDSRHGTANGYQNCDCRCAECRTAASEYHSTLKQRERTLPPDDPRHGTANAYRYWHCHCDLCRANASSEARAGKERRAKERAQGLTPARVTRYDDSTNNP